MKFKLSSHTSPYKFEISQNSVKSTVRSEIDQFRSKIGSGGKLFSSFCCNQNCSEVSILVVVDQLLRFGKRELICLLLFTCNYVVSVWRGFLFPWVLGMGNVIFIVSLPEPSI